MYTFMIFKGIKYCYLFDFEIVLLSSLITPLSISDCMLEASSPYCEFDERISLADGHLDRNCDAMLEGALMSLLSSPKEVAPEMPVAKLCKVTWDVTTLFWVSFETERLSDGLLPASALRSFEGYTLFRFHRDTFDVDGAVACGASLLEFFNEARAATAAIAARLFCKCFPSCASDAVKLIRLFLFSRRFLSLCSNRLQI